MKLKNLVGQRFKERPADCVIDSHALMVRGGYMKYVANGIFSSYMPLKRITKKIEQIIREEMAAKQAGYPDEAAKSAETGGKSEKPEKKQKPAGVQNTGSFWHMRLLLNGRNPIMRCR